MPNGDDHRQWTLVEMAQFAERDIKNLEEQKAELLDVVKGLEAEKKALLETIRLLKNDNS